MGKKDELKDVIAGRLRLRKPEPIYRIPRMGMDIPPGSPSSYFYRKFPDIAQVYGPPVLEYLKPHVDLTEVVDPIALNEEFFAMLLGGDKALGHQVIFYIPEQQFYFYDCRFGYFVPTTEEKLLVVLSQHLIKCAEAMPQNTVDVGPLFLPLRGEAYLKRIVRRAKVLLAADRTFFESKEGHKRRCGDRILDPALEPPHKLFIKESLAVQPGHILTVNDCYQGFTVYCSSRGFTPIERRQFPSLVVEGIREQFGLGFRKDLVLDGHYYRGWKGIAPVRIGQN